MQPFVFVFLVLTHTPKNEQSRPVGEFEASFGLTMPQYHLRENAALR